MQVPFGAMAATGRGSLFSRIKRLVKPDEQTNGPFQSLFTITLVTFGVLLMARYTGTLHASPLPNQTQKQTTSLDFLEPLVPETGEGRINFSDGGKKMTLLFENFKLVTFKVDGKKLALSEVVTYRKEIEGIIVKLAELNEQVEQMEEKAVAMERNAQEMAITMEASEAAAKERNREAAELQHEAAELQAEASGRELEAARLERAAAELEQQSVEMERAAAELERHSAELERASAEMKEMKEMKELKARKPARKSKSPKKPKVPEPATNMSYPKGDAPAIAPAAPLTPERMASIKPAAAVVPSLSPIKPIAALKPLPAPRVTNPPD